MSKEFREIVEISNKEDIKASVLNNMTNEELSIFFKILDTYNRELEGKIMKNNEHIFLKKNCVKFLLKRTWISLEEIDKSNLVQFFKEVDEFITNI
ncbi:uncharacterized protein VNE69_03049 [Vairimorpha necatrix]|uniref:Uncharacterized protein n=1 Tax=Vairimorpha necatrix TaxID=6039 RepID=A0AAX4JA74_9MICR